MTLDLNGMAIGSLVAPNGIVYVKPEVRKGLLGRMLVELLETRVMVKQALKGVRNNDVRLCLPYPGDEPNQL